MNKFRFLSIAVVALLVVNVVLIAMFFMRRPPHHRPEPKEIIIERLHLSEAQIKDYEVLINQHRNSIHQLEGDLMNVRNQMYTGIGNGMMSNRDSLEVVLAQIHAKIEVVNYDHFVDIQELCTPEQLPAFKALTTEIAQLFAKPTHKP